jgi:Transposase DDE domain
MTLSQSGKVCVTVALCLGSPSATPNMAVDLGRWRWVVERTFAWMNQFRRLRVRYEKRADIHEAFLSLGCALICWRFLRVDWVAG